MNMHIEFRKYFGAQPPGRLSILSLSMLVIVTCIALFPCTQSTQAENRRVQAAPAGDERPVDRRRWWLDIWSHSMQETCFITWMNTQFGCDTWQWVLPAQQVNSLYLWWSIAVWEEPNGK
ncbi:MAG: hypothetical protein WCO75_01550 [Planctomycetota bacterium]